MDRSFQPIIATVAGALLIPVGILGFLSAPFLGAVAPNSAQNATHLLLGAAGVVCGAWIGSRAARWYHRIGGVVFSTLAVIGAAGIAPVSTFFNLTGTSAWVHGAFGVLFLVVGFGVKD